MTSFELYKIALEGMSHRPRDLDRALQLVSNLDDREVSLVRDDLFALLEQNDANEPIAIIFHQKLAGWDYLSDPEWAGGTARNTIARRSIIYESLGLAASDRSFCDTRYPYAPALDPPIAITDDETGLWRPWYTAERQAARGYYWQSYSEYLRDKKRWEAKNLAALDEASRDVVQRLADPESLTPYQSKGLVVGYVQSGKTANFTGVIARAADAGYRLFIVLAGTINILRDQTQRRLDKELVGTEMCKDEHYEHDEDYVEFISHGGLPSEKGIFDWERLTGSKDDFTRLRKGISALEFRAYDPRQPFYAPANLHRERARLLVVKKNTTVLDKLLDDLQRVAERINISNVPTVVIDDESDQASINTWRPRQPHEDLEKEREKRSETNKRIVKLLKLLPRAQYVGYTATPFANVFIDPDDAEDLFPADFIVSLPKPEGYMGVAEFYDDTKAAEGDYSSNEQAFVRFVDGVDDSEENLPRAIDAFVLAGAVKLFREKISNGRFKYKHHTMLIHNSPRIFVHAEQANRVEKLLTAANYLGAGEGLPRLRRLWDEDFSKVSAVRASSLPMPDTFTDLLPFIGECCRRIEEGKPVLIINGNNRDDSPNFEKTGVWKILVGGTKLSRGYTVEGLTVSYYRRRAGAADTLMQMGRWFGFRQGYKDLVRLYIGKNERVNATKFINLYEAFRATCQDEEDFRKQLQRYSSLEPGHRITPRQVPPLVSQHMLPPTSPNKMFNARIAFKNLANEWREKTVAPSSISDIKHNEALLRKLVTGTAPKRHNIAVDALVQGPFKAITAQLRPDLMLEFLSGYRWLPGFEAAIVEVTEFLRGEGEHDPGIDNWLFFAPQQKSDGDKWECAGEQFGVRERSRIETGGRYKAYSEPDHRRAAEFFAGGLSSSISNGGIDLSKSRQGVFLFYPVRSAEETDNPPTMGFSLYFPKNAIKDPIRYTVADSTRSDAIVIPAASAAKAK